MSECAAVFETVQNCLKQIKKYKTCKLERDSKIYNILKEWEISEFTKKNPDERK